MLVSAAYLDNLFNGTSYRTDANDEEDERNVNRYGQHPQLRSDPAVMALLPQAVTRLASSASTAGHHCAAAASSASMKIAGTLQPVWS